MSVVRIVDVTHRYGRSTALDRVGLTVEAGELLECFQWSAEADPQEVEGELADVLTYAYLLADRLGLDPETVIRTKLETTRAKYPVEKARGRSTKHDRL